MYHFQLRLSHQRNLQKKLQTNDLGSFLPAAVAEGDKETAGSEPSAGRRVRGLLNLFLIIHLSLLAIIAIWFSLGGVT